MQHTVDPEPHPQRVLFRLEVNVGCAVVDGLRDQQVDIFDDRRVLGHLLEIGEVLNLFILGINGQADVVEFALRAVVPVDGGNDVPAGGHPRAYVDCGSGTQIVQSHHVCRVGHGHEQFAVFKSDRNHGVAPTQAARNRRQS